MQLSLRKQRPQIKNVHRKVASCRDLPLRTGVFSSPMQFEEIREKIETKKQEETREDEAAEEEEEGGWW